MINHLPYRSLTSNAGPSIYTNLKIEGRQIRLLTIVSTAPEVTCQLEVADLKDGPAFNALSYVWGDPTITETIVVNGIKVQVTENLACALKYAPQLLNQASGEAIMKLWADAICINQKDIAEKNHQVPFMKDIYSKADIVLCWLGPPSEPIFEAMNLMEIVARERLASGADDEDLKLQHGLVELTQRLENQANELREALENQHIPVVDETTPESAPLGDVEANALTKSLQDATQMIFEILQRSGGIRPGLDLNIAYLKSISRGVSSCLPARLPHTDSSMYLFQPSGLPILRLTIASSQFFL